MGFERLSKTAIALLSICTFCFSGASLPCLATPEQAAQLDIKLAEGLCARNHWSKAKPILVKLARSRYATREVFLNLGHSYMVEYDATNNDLSQAEVYTKKALQLDPNWGCAYRQLSQIALLRDDYQSAIDNGTRAVAAKEPDYGGYYHRAKGYAAINQYAKALPDLDMWLKTMAPKDQKGDSAKNTLSVKGTVLEHLGRYNDAIAVYREVLPYHREWTIGSIIRCLRVQGKLGAAIDETTKLIEGNKQDDEAYRTRADLKAMNHDLKGAVADYTSAINLVPSNRYFKARAKLYEQLGQKDLAKKDLEKADSSF